MLIVTNFRSFPPKWTASCGQTGATVLANTRQEFLACRNHAGAVFLVNCDPHLTLRLAAALLTCRRPRPPLISVDLVLRRPASLPDRLALPAKRFLFSRVDHFIHYFRDLRGLRQTFGIRPERSSFVPFKVNLSDHHRLPPRLEGEYVLCFGRSLRDYDTFFAAMERLPCPGAIARPNLVQLRRHGARFTRPLEALPPNVRCLDDDDTEAAQIRILSGARLVVLPILSSSIVASGISTCLNAMLLGKCVIGSDGPGMGDVFTAGELLTVPPEDPPALAEKIRQAWEDNALRLRTAAAGRAFAERAGGERELYARVIDDLAAWLRNRPRAG